jgi:hypothetical protein
VLAANTAFADFPRLSSLLARDRFLPRQFADRLVFSNGIVILAILSGVLVITKETAACFLPLCLCGRSSFVVESVRDVAGSL